MSYLIVIPALNPKSDLIEYVDNLISHGYSHILVVDDGSRDECRSVFEEIENRPECEILRHPVNMGKGRALKDAMSVYSDKYMAESYPEDNRPGGIITVDSDGQHVVEDVNNVADAMSKNPDSLILGARDFNLDNVPWKSRFGNKCTVTVLKLFIGGNISDTQTGLRGIPNSLIDRFSDLHGDRFEYETVMLIDAIHSGASIVEVPIRTVYINENSETHFHPVKDSLKIYSVILGTFFKYILSSLLSFAVDYGLFCVLIALLAGFDLTQAKSVWISTIAARVCSSLFNYTLNKRMVFKSRRGPVTLILYYTLCVEQMIASAGFVSLIGLTGLPVQIAKIIIDTFLFIISYYIQHRYVFKET